MFELIFKKVSFYFICSFNCISTVLCFEVSIKLFKKKMFPACNIPFSNYWIVLILSQYIILRLYLLKKKKCILKRSLFMFLQFQFYQRSSSLWTTRVWRSSGYVPLPVGCPTWPEVWTVNSVSAMIRNTQVIHLFFLFYISWSLLFMPFVFN